MINGLNHFAAESSATGIGALGFDGKAFLIQLITFVLALFILKKYAFGPISKIMLERRQTIEAGVKLGEDMRKERQKLSAEVDEQLHKARKDADGIIANANDAARQTVREAEAKAHDKADAIIAEAKTRTEQDVVRARQQLESEIVSLISDATETIIDEKVDSKKDAALISKALKEHARS